MNSFFKELFEYSFVMNDQIISKLKNDPSSFPKKSLELLNHILNAQQIWNSRVKGVPDSCKVWELRPWEQLEEINSENRKVSMEILDTVSLDRPISYVNSRGEKFTNSVRDVLFHVINHSTYHRAQIATEMKRTGLAPVTTDYIFYKR